MHERTDLTCFDLAQKNEDFTQKGWDVVQYNLDFGANIQPGPTVQNTTILQKTCSNLFVGLLEKVVESTGKSGK